MIGRIFSGFYNPFTTIVFFLAILVIKIGFLLFLGAAAIFPNLCLSFFIGFALVKSAQEHPDDSIFWRLLCWVIAFSQIGSLTMVRI